MQSNLTDAEKLAPFLGYIVQAADEAGELRSRLAALVMRESGATWDPNYRPQGDPRGTGDAGHGHGLCQIDDRTYGDWIHACNWGDPLINLRKACAILRADRGYLRSLFSMPGVPPDTFERTIYAAFNAGPTNARKGLIHHGDPDTFTAPRAGKHDYSAWIWAKAQDLCVQLPVLSLSPKPVGA